MTPDAARVSSGRERTWGKLKADRALTALMWNSQISLPSVVIVAASNCKWATGNPKCSCWYLLATACTDTMQTVLRDSRWHSLIFTCFRTRKMPILVAWAPFQTCALHPVWRRTLGITWRKKKGTRNVWSIQSPSGNSLTKPREIFYYIPVCSLMSAWGLFSSFGSDCLHPGVLPYYDTGIFFCCEDMLNNHASMHRNWWDKVKAVLGYICSQCYF